MDQWTKALVVEHLSSYDTGPKIYLIGQYLLLFFIRNNGAAFSLFANSIVLVGLIILVVGANSYIYARKINTGSMAIKLIFGMIVGGALGNIIDRVRHAGYVVDFIAFRIPQIGFYFAIFNIADAAISVGVFLLFVALLFGSFPRPRAAPHTPPGTSPDARTPTRHQDGSLHNQQHRTPLT